MRNFSLELFHKEPALIFDALRTFQARHLPQPAEAPADPAPRAPGPPLPPLDQPGAQEPPPAADQPVPVAPEPLDRPEALAPMPDGSAPPHWCVCNNCREMPTDIERLCCQQQPQYCTILLPQFHLYCLDAGNLRIHRRYRDDVLVVARDREPGDDNREYRHAAYRNFIFWQHGALGAGVRRVIPACVIRRVRASFADPFNRYTGFIPGH